MKTKSMMKVDAKIASMNSEQLEKRWYFLLSKLQKLSFLETYEFTIIESILHLVKKGRKEQLKKQTIAEILKEYLDNNGLIVNGASQFSGKDFNDILSVVDGTADNFIIFNNSGGRRFHIWLLKDMKKGTTPKDLKGWVVSKGMSQYVYMYKINGKETIVRVLI